MHGFLTALDVVLGVGWAFAGMWQRFTGRSMYRDFTHPHGKHEPPTRHYYDQGRWMLGLGAVWLFTAAFRAKVDHPVMQAIADGCALAAVALAFLPVPFKGHDFTHRHHHEAAPATGAPAEPRATDDVSTDG